MLSWQWRFRSPPCPRKGLRPPELSNSVFAVSHELFCPTERTPGAMAGAKMPGEKELIVRKPHLLARCANTRSRSTETPVQRTAGGVHRRRTRCRRRGQPTLPRRRSGQLRAAYRPTRARASMDSIVGPSSRPLWMASLLPVLRCRGTGRPPGGARYAAPEAEIVNLERPKHGEHRALHVAVLGKNPAMVRLLMQNGAMPAWESGPIATHQCAHVRRGAAL